MEQKNQNTALLVMDMQAGIIGQIKEKKEALLQALKKTIESARNNKIPVIYCVLGFRKNYPEASDNNKAFAMIKNSERQLDAPEAMILEETIKPLPNEIVVTKKRYSAFTGSDLEIVLRSFSIQHLVLTGISTSGVVLSTCREAADKDYKLTIISDCCADGDDEVHRVLTTKIFPRQAYVVDHKQWIESL